MDKFPTGPLREDTGTKYNYKPFVDIVYSIGWDDIEDHKEVENEMRILVAKEMQKRGKSYNNFYVEKENIYNKLYKKYNYNAWNIEDAYKDGEDIFDGIEF